MSDSLGRVPAIVDWLTDQFRWRREWPSAELAVAARAAGLGHTALWSPEVGALPIRKSQAVTASGERFWVWAASPGWPPGLEHEGGSMSQPLRGSRGETGMGVSLFPDRADDDGPIKTITRYFEGVPVIVARRRDGTVWLSWSSIRMACLGWSGGPSLFNKFVTLLVDVDGVIQHERFVSRDAFLSAALVSEQFPEFHRYVVGMLEDLDDGRSVMPPSVADHPTMKMLKALTDSTAAAITAEQLARETAQRTDKLEIAVADANRKADIARDAAINGSWAFAIPWLGHNGVRVPKDKDNLIQMAVGKEIAKIAREIGDDPDSRDKRQNNGFHSNWYPSNIMEKVGRIWIERHRDDPARRSWFRRPY